MRTNPRIPVCGAALLCAYASAAAPGTAAATPSHESASGRDGPTVMIVGGMHGNVPARVTPELMTPAPAHAPPGAPIRVALYDGAGNGGAGLAKVAARLGAGPGFAPVRVCPEDIRAGALRRFDAAVFTGGSGSAQGKALGKDGRAEVRRLVERGGGYVGICAGAYLACRGFPTWGLGIIDAKTLSPEWRRGRAVVKLELTGPGRTLFDGPPGRFDCLYHQGPIVGPAHAPELPDYEPLALFRTEVAKNGTPEGIMVNAPAIFAGTCGKGRVVCFSPHPEQTDGLDDLVPRAVRWAAGRIDAGGTAANTAGP